MRIRKILATASLALATSVQAAPDTPPPAVIHARPALWMVRDADTTIYLFGTIHKLRAGTTWIQGPVKQALDASGTVMVEVDMSNAAAVPAALKAHSVAHDGKTMAERLPEAMRARYRARLAEFNLPEKALDRLQPWAVASMIGSMVQRKNGIVREEGVEDQLLAAAKAGGKRIDGLETLDQQFGYFEQMSEAEQVAQLSAVLGDEKPGKDVFNRLSRDWAAGHEKRLARDMSSDMPASIREVLVYKRNRNWAASIRSMLDKPGIFFIAVGSGHLVGKRNLRNDLLAMGVKNERLQ